MKSGWLAGLVSGMLMFGFAAVSFAAYWTGSGTSRSPDFYIVDPLGTFLQFDTPSSGIMYQNSMNHPGDIGLGGAYIRLTDSAATAELNHAKGWFFETRVYAVQNIDSPTRGGWTEYLGVSITFSDDVGFAFIMIRPDGIDVVDKSLRNLGTYTHNTPGYHTIRVQSVANSPSAFLYVDGIECFSFNLDPQGFSPMLYFGDPSSGSDGEAYWDYFAINTPTPPTNSQPVANAGENINLFSESVSTTTIHGTATDQNTSAVLSYRWQEGQTILLDWSSVAQDGDCPLALAAISLSNGTHTLTLKVSDGRTTATDDMILTIENSAPHAAPLGAGKYEVNAPVTLDGQVSDYDGDTLNYQWLDGTDVLFSDSIESVAGGSPVQLPLFITSSLAIGAHDITLTIDDGVNAAVRASFLVVMIDDLAPILKPRASQTILWPPNHKMVPITIQANASDNSGLMPSLSATVISNEPLDDPSGDWTQPVIDQTTGTIALELRADRSGKGNGRTYTITITATDISGNASSASVKVLVPHDQGKK